MTNEIILNKKVEMDDQGNIIYTKENGKETWISYTNSGKITCLKNSEGFELNIKYDKYGNATSYKDTNGEEWKCEYTEKGDIVHYKNIADDLEFKFKSNID